MSVLTCIEHRATGEFNRIANITNKILNLNTERPICVTEKILHIEEYLCFWQHYAAIQGHTTLLSPLFTRIRANNVFLNLAMCFSIQPEFELFTSEHVTWQFNKL